MYLIYITAVSLLVISSAAGQSTTTSVEPANTTVTQTSEATTHSSPATTANESTSALTSASTAAPVSSTTPTPTTVAPPKTSVSYAVVDGKTVCIVLNATINFTLPYQTRNGIATISYSLPSGGSTESSSCNATWSGTYGQLLSVTKFQDNWIFELFFENSSNSFAASKLRLTYTVTNGTLFPNAEGTQKVVASFDGSYQHAIFTSSINGYYSCNSAFTTTLNTTLNATGTNVKISNLSAFAFSTQNSTHPTGTMTQCSADAVATDYLVPIIVGCALAAIIIIVLIAYIIGRYRSRNTYQSV